MTDIDISTAAVERLLDGVTAGPWTVTGTSIIAPDSLDPDTPWDVAVMASFCGYPSQTEANTAFIAASRDLVPALLADRDRLAAERDAARDALQSIIDDVHLTMTGRTSLLGKIARTAKSALADMQNGGE